MSQTRLSKSKTRILIKAMPSTEVLHKGYQRKIAQSEYIKTFPKMKLRLNGRNNTASISQNQPTEEHILDEIEKMKLENKRLEDMNQDLLARIRKESKFNEIYEKKMQKVTIQNMPLQKILQIKLLLQVQELEEIVRIKEEAMAEIIKNNNRKRKQTKKDVQPRIELHALLISYQQIEDEKYEREKKLKTADARIDELTYKRQILNHTHKLKLAELNNTKLSIERQHLSASNRQEVIQESNENSFISGVNRTKSIEDTEAQLQRIREEHKEYELKLQMSVDSKVKQKLSIMREMQQVSAKLQKLRHNRNPSVMVAW